MELQRFDVVMTPDGPGVLVAEWEDGRYEVEFETALDKLDGRTFPADKVTFVQRPHLWRNYRYYSFDKMKNAYPAAPDAAPNA